MSKIIIEIDLTQAGQARPYADTIYEAAISARVEKMLTNNSIFYRSLNQETVKQLTRLFVREFEDEPGSPWAATLTTCEPIGPTEEMKRIAHKKWQPGRESRWKVRVTEMFTD